MDESDGVPEAGPGLFPPGVGERLRAAREAAKLDLNDIATRTRVPMRHLEALERGDYTALPSPTYAIGFGRAYARAVGVDDRDVARALRVELGRAPLEAMEAAPYEPIDPARVPSRLLAWTAAGVAVLLLAGYLWVSRARFDWQSPAPSPVAATPAPAPAPVTPEVPARANVSGDVVLTATSPVWVRIYDRQDKVLLQKEMAAGERFTVPTDAVTPMIRTGRGDALQVTVGGKTVAPLGPPERTIRDVVLTAEALSAREAAPLPGSTTPANVASAPSGTAR